MSDRAFEINFDGIVGPTHNYAGLSFGNLASRKHANQPSNPEQAALEGLAKMKFLADLGIRQAVLPPQERPDVAALRRLGFSGNDKQILEKAAKDDPILLAACGSASAMWAANAATVSPSADSADGRAHFTAANLPTQFHRSLEAATTSRILRAIFADEVNFTHHSPLPAGVVFGDEGAANHTRLTAGDYGLRGLQIFVYGRDAFGGEPAPAKFPARQTRQASEAIARLHNLNPADVLFVRQNPAAIDAGAFHNDVVAVGNLNVLLYHSTAFANPKETLRKIRRWFGDREFHAIEVTEEQVPLADAVSSYLFNGQLVQTADGMALIAPLEARDCPSAEKFLQELLARGGPIRRVEFIDVRQSMNNGGGPACLRLRVVLTEKQIAAIRPTVFLTDDLHRGLGKWIEKHYRDRLFPADLADPKLLEEGRTALDELTRMLGLGSIYPFQGAA